MRSAVIGFRFFFASFIVPNNATRPAALVHAPLRGGAVLAFARLVHVVGALARPLAAGAGAVPGGVQLVGNLRPREAGAAVLDDGRKRFLLALVPLAAPVDELETVRRNPAGGPALRLEYLKRC